MLEYDQAFLSFLGVWPNGLDEPPQRGMDDKERGKRFVRGTGTLLHGPCNSTEDRTNTFSSPEILVVKNKSSKERRGAAVDTPA